jgi:hypothetical protein
MGMEMKNENLEIRGRSLLAVVNNHRAESAGPRQSTSAD